VSHDLRGRTLSAADFLDTPIDEPPALVVDLIPGGTVTVLAGQHKVGKTIAMLQMSLAVASGQPWIEWATAQRRVVYYNGEVAEWGFQQRLKKALNGFTGQYGKHAAAAVRQNLFTNTLSDLRINKPGDLKIIRDHVEQTNAGLCVLDPINFFYTGPRNEDETVSRVMSQILTEIVHPTGCAVVLGHHMRKPAPGDSGSGSTWEVKGSGVWADSADQILTLRWDRQDKSRLGRLFNATCRYYEGKEDVHLTLRPASMLYEAAKPTGDGIAPTDLGQLKAAFAGTMNGELTMADIASALGISKDAAHKRWQRGQYPNVVQVSSTGFYEWRQQ
jgi:hypothetical protein